MKTRATIQRALAVTAVLALVQPAWAQVAAPRPQQDDPAKPQVQTFEMVLGRALETAGRNFAARATELAPDMMPVVFPTADTPNVTGVAVHDLGLYVFQVQVPGISLTLQVMNMMVNRPGFPGAMRAGTQTVGNNGRVEAGGAVSPDPMDGAPASTPPTRLDFQAEYRLLVRDALVDALLDNSGSLPMGANDTLLVVASGIDSAVSNPLYRTPSRKLVLRAKGSDLAAFREGRITRDEAKQRVQATSF